MDLRKAQLTGGSSITVTLPKTWAERSKIRAGDVLGCVEQSDGSLSIYPHAKGERPLQKYDIEADGKDVNLLFRKIVAAYLMGYDQITVRAKRSLAAPARLTIRDAVRKIIGLEIVDEEPNAITIQDFLDPREFHMDKALRRMSMLTQAMQEEALAALQAPSHEAAASVEERDDEVDRLLWLVNKHYHAMLRDANYAAKIEMTASQGLNFLLVARLVERVADHADRMAQQAALIPAGKIPETLTARVVKQGRRAAEISREALQTFFRQDTARANAIIEEANEFQRAQERLLKDVSVIGGEPLAHLAFIIESIGRTAAYAADIAEVAINHKVASQR